jgi:hypothetical protein
LCAEVNETLTLARLHPGIGDAGVPGKKTAIEQLHKCLQPPAGPVKDKAKFLNFISCKIKALNGRIKKSTDQRDIRCVLAAADGRD